NTVNGTAVSKFYKSGAFTAFDVDPKNKYMKTDGQAVFTKNGKTLLSYARYNKSTEYHIPEGTQKIGDSALRKCDHIKTLYIPESVREIEQWSLAQMNALESIVFDSFDVKIDKRAFAILYYEYEEPETEFVCTKTVQPYVKGTQISWKPAEGAAYYEIYQKLNSGEYKLLKTTKAASCKFKALKSGKKYTFAVKPVAVIPAANYDKEKDDGEYPESFTIEGTMSEDIVVIGK
ncbi:MAG: leucine-rich repeat protein, partial [Huintestinicola sp.]